MFAIGDRVVYPMHGGAVIKNIEQRIHDGAEVDYYVLEMLFEHMIVAVPVANAERLGLRYIVGKEKLDDVAKVLMSTPDVFKVKSISWNRRFQIYMDCLKTGDIEEVARIFKILSILESKKKISVGERRLLHNTKQILQSELMLVEDMDGEAAERWIYKYAKE